MPKLRPTTKAAVLRRDGAACRYCGHRVYQDVPETWSNRLTMDHLWCNSEDGSNGMHNLVVSCRRCNKRKGSDDPVGKWLPLPPPEDPPALVAHGEVPDNGTPVVPVDRPRIHVPYLSRTKIREMEGGMWADAEMMRRLRWHRMDPSVDENATP